MIAKRRYSLKKGDIIKLKNCEEFCEVTDSFFTRYPYSNNYHGWINLKNKGRFYEESIYKIFEREGNYILVYDRREIKDITLLSVLNMLSHINFKLLKWSCND